MPRSHLLRVVLQLFQDRLGSGNILGIQPVRRWTWGFWGGKGSLLCKLCYVNFPSLSAVCSIVKKPQKNKYILYRRKTFLYVQPQYQLLIGSSTSLHYLLPLLSSSDFVLLVSDISRCKLNFNAATSLLQITAIQTQYIHFLFGAHAVSVLPRWILYIPLYIFK